MRIPEIRRSGGIFEIFIPGMFVFLHGSVAAFIIFYDEIKFLLVQPEGGWQLPLVITIAAIAGFGFLIGFILRLLKTRFPDSVSSKYLKLKYRILGKKGKVRALNSKYPYIKALGKYIESRINDKEFQAFYREVWLPNYLEDGNRRFLNHCKNMLNRKDATIMDEVRTLETMIRYTSGMFYSLLISVLILMILQIFIPFSGLLWFLVGTYILFMMGILANFRGLKVKEVETIIDATFQYKEIFWKKDEGLDLASNPKEQSIEMQKNGEGKV